MADHKQLASDATTVVEQMRRLNPASHGEATLAFETHMRNKVVGQETAIDAVVEVYRTFLVGMKPDLLPSSASVSVGLDVKMPVTY